MNTALDRSEDPVVQILRAQLRQFGLNPSDWHLEPRGRGRVRLTHFEDREFRLVGFFDPIRLKWADLHLVSL